MVRRILAVLVFMTILITLAGCGDEKKSPSKSAPTPTTSPVTLTISGSGSVTLILTAVQPTLETDVPNFHLNTLAGTGTGGGVQGVTEKVLDLAAMARPPKDDELKAAPGLKYVEFGQVGQALLAHADVNVANLTKDQAKAIFLGEIVNWSEVGGPDQPIVLFVRDEADTSTQTLRKDIFGDTPFPETAHVVTSQSSMISSVAGIPGSVGFGTWPAVLAEQANVDSVAIDGIGPSDPTYPFTNPIGIGYLDERQKDVQPLIDWLLSEQGRAALQKLDVIITQ